MNQQELRRFRKLCNLVKKFPALENRLKSIRRKELKGLLALAYEDDNGFHIVISKKEGFYAAVDDLAHELAHILVDMSNDHGELFKRMEQALMDVLRILLKKIPADE